MLPSGLETELFDRRGLERYFRLGTGSGAAYAAYRNFLADDVSREGEKSNRSRRPEGGVRGDCEGVAIGFD